MNAEPRIVVAGAGSIGCFVGGLMLANGRDVSFLGRERIAGELKTHGLTLTDYAGLETHIAPVHIDIDVAPQVLAKADVILVTVKSGATFEIANLIATHAPPSAIVISLQNGVRNAETLRKALPEMDVRAGMVPFNVVHLADGHFHRGTSGGLVVETGTPDIARTLQSEHLQASSSADMEAVQWGKLLINLNNGLNALSGIPLVEQLSQRGWRKKFAEQMDEAIAVLSAEGIEPSPPSPVPAWMVPHILRLPTFLFRLVAKQMLAIDPQARSSMWEDIRLGRKTEIDELQGEIVRLGEKHGIPTPANRRVMQQIREIERTATKP